MAVSYKDINQLTQKSSVAGTEKLPVSDTQYITPEQIAALGIIGDGVENIVTLTNAEYQALATKDPNTIYVVTDIDSGGGGGGGGGGGITDVTLDGTSVVSNNVASLPAYPTTLPASDVSAWAKASSKPSYNFSEIESKPTTLSGYGITDAKIQSGTITLGNNTITPLTSFTESDPVFSASAAHGISSTDINNWNAKQKAITVSTSEPTSSQGSNGDIWIVI